MQDTTYIVYHPGTFGNLLCFILDKFSGNEKFKKIQDPFDSDRRLHSINGYSGKFIPIHPDRSDSIKNKKISITYKETQSLLIDRCEFYRNIGKEDSNKRYQSIIEENKQLVSEYFNLKESAEKKIVVKELLKLRYKNKKTSNFVNYSANLFDNKNNYMFPIECLINPTLFLDHLKEISQYTKIKFNIDIEYINFICDKISNISPMSTFDRANKIIDSIYSNHDLDCTDLDIVEQAWIENILEVKHKGLFFPYGMPFFSNTKEIKNIISTLPSYYKTQRIMLPVHV